MAWRLQGASANSPRTTSGDYQLSSGSSNNPKSKLCFVVSPIGAEDSEERIHADWLLDLIIKPVMADFPDYRVKRADEDPRPGLIDAQMINDLLNAELVIADLSLLNPNVFYEIGIRHMAQKPIIHMQLVSGTTPFDLSLYRAIKFALKKPKDWDSARAALRTQVTAVLAEGYEVENPVTNARGRIKLQEHATSEQQVFIGELEGIKDRLQRLETWNPSPFRASDLVIQAGPGAGKTFYTLDRSLKDMPTASTNEAPPVSKPRSKPKPK
jgi:hypothetical protein